MKTIVVVMLFVSTTLGVYAQTDDETLYIAQYKDVAIAQSKKSNIPVSIILGQAILESDAGASKLASMSNNHFGIKVGNDWKGKFVRHNDDKPKEKFRRYASVEESYADHSKFLQKKRYQHLFSIDPCDYKAWAYGLKKAGYATNRSYAIRLINVIERNNLQQFDAPSEDVEPDYTMDY